MKTIRVGGIEYISFGDYVAIGRSLRAVQLDNDVWEQIPYGQPYIDFPAFHQVGTGQYYLDDDDSISGGLSPEEARQVAAELLLAAEWMEENS